MTRPAPTPTPYELLLARSDPGAPFVTHYDGAGGRTELSVGSTANGVAKAAGLLRDGVGLAPGGVVSLDLPRHWQLPVWTLAALSVGARVGTHLAGPVDVRLVGPAALAGPAAGADPGADEVLASACDAFGMPIPGGVPAGIIDVGLEARAHPDVLAVEPGAADVAVLLVDGREQPWPALLARHVPAAGAPAAGSGGAPGPGPRIWLDATVPDADLLLVVAVLPLLLGGSVVLDAGLPHDTAATTRGIEAVTVDAAALLGWAR